jgi:hypothetical protein
MKLSLRANHRRRAAIISPPRRIRFPITHVFGRPLGWLTRWVAYHVEMTGWELREGSGSARAGRKGPTNKLGLTMICLAILLAGCGGSFRGNASAGPNPGGGFYGAPNIDIGRINP